MRSITRTIFGSQLQEQLLLGLPFTMVANTTLNEKFGIAAGRAPDPGTMPHAGYFCIGNGGHQNLVGADGKPYTAAIQHSPGDAALYSHMPFLIRDPANDLDVTTRQKYALRQQIVANGNNYIAYWLKRLDFTNVVPQMQLNHVVDGTTTSTPYVPTGANLNPTPPAIPNPGSGVVTTTGDYLSTSAVLRLDFTAQDVAELVNVAKVLWNNELLAVISEVGLVSGVDAIATGIGAGNQQFNYLEAIAAQIVTHLNAYYPVSYMNQGFDFGLELGSTEPLVGISDAVTGS
jgi:hypothetical protein